MEEWPSTVRRSAVKFIEKPFGKSLKLTSLRCAHRHAIAEKKYCIQYTVECVCVREDAFMVQRIMALYVKLFTASDMASIFL